MKPTAGLGMPLEGAVVIILHGQKVEAAGFIDSVDLVVRSDAVSPDLSDLL